MLAIVIPYYKLTFFEETLQSLANQTDKRFKVYIGNDASQEDPDVLLGKYQGQFDFVYIQFDQNLGGHSLVQQWNRCIAMTEEEEWIMILGDDDLLDQNVVKEFYTFIDNKQLQIDLIRFNLKIIDVNGKIRSDDFSFSGHETAQDLLDRMFSIKEMITASEFIFSKSIYKQNNGFIEFPLAWFSDYATWLVFSKNSGIYNINNESVYWRLSEINISSKSINIRETESKIQSLFLFMSFLQDHFIIEKKKQKEYTFVHLFNLTSDVKFFKICKILSKCLFKYKFKFSEIIILEFIFKKMKRKTIKIYGDICAASKR